MSWPTRNSQLPIENAERREPSSGLRVPLRVPVTYRSLDGDAWGEGTSWNLSTSGALLEHVTRPVAVGTELLLWFSVFPGSTGTALPGTVTRLTERGFAVRFGKLDDEQALLLKRALPDGA